MELGSVFLILALLVLVVLFVIRPIIEKKQPALDAEGDLTRPIEHQLKDRYSSLLLEHHRSLNALYELDFDFALGKIPEEDYSPQRALLLKRGAEILQKLDSCRKETTCQSEQEGVLIPDPPYLLKAAMTGLQSSHVKNVPPQQTLTAPQAGSMIMKPDDDLEILLARRRRARQEKAAGFCPKCGSPVQKSDHFCPKCGARMG